MITKINAYKLFENINISLNKLNEGLILTHDIVDSYNILTNINYLWINPDKSVIKNNKIIIVIGKVEPIDILSFSNLLNTIYNLGYYISEIRIHTSNKLTKLFNFTEFKEMYFTNEWFNLFEQLDITLEPKFDIRINDIPDKLYHLTYQKYQNKILSKGLIPKTTNLKSTYPERIYFADSIDNVLAYYKNKHTELKTNFIKDKTLKIGKNKFSKLSDMEICIFEIDTNNLNIDLYKDPNFINGFYTMDNIIQNNIKLIDDFNI